MNCKKFLQLDERFGVKRLVWAAEIPKPAAAAAPAPKPEALKPPEKVAVPPPVATPKAEPERAEGLKNVIRAANLLTKVELLDATNKKQEKAPEADKAKFDAIYTPNNTKFDAYYKGLLTGDKGAEATFKDAIKALTPEEKATVVAYWKSPIDPTEVTAVKTNFGDPEKAFKAITDGTASPRELVAYFTTFKDEDVEKLVPEDTPDKNTAAISLNITLYELRDSVLEENQAPTAEDINKALESLVKDKDKDKDTTQLDAYNKLFTEDPQKKAKDGAAFLAKIDDISTKNVLRWNLFAPITKKEAADLTNLVTNLKPTSGKIADDIIKDFTTLNKREPTTRELLNASNLVRATLNNSTAEKKEILKKAVEGAAFSDVLEKLGTQLAELIDKLTKFFEKLFKKKEAPKFEKSPFGGDKKIVISNDFTATGNKGVDITTTQNQEISAVAGGKVTNVDAEHNAVTVQYGTGSIVYTGMNASVTQGTEIKVGTKLGTAIGASINFATLNKENAQVDPAIFLRDFIETAKPPTEAPKAEATPPEAPVPAVKTPQKPPEASTNKPAPPPQQPEVQETKLIIEKHDLLPNMKLRLDTSVQKVIARTSNSIKIKFNDGTILAFANLANTEAGREKGAYIGLTGENSTLTIEATKSSDLTGIPDQMFFQILEKKIKME